MSGKEIAAKLREALALMNDSGKHWVQGASRMETMEGTKYCSIGAIRTVVLGDAYGSLDGENEPEYPVTVALAAVLSNGGLDGEDAANTIINWNDDGRRTWSDIVAAFTEAAEKAETEGA